MLTVNLQAQEEVALETSLVLGVLSICMAKPSWLMGERRTERGHDDIPVVYQHWEANETTSNVGECKRLER